MSVDEAEVPELVLHDVRDRTSWVTLNRPERLNAIDVVTHVRFEEVLREADTCAESDVVVVTGAGRAFCAGGDVRAMRGADRFGVDERMRVRTPGRRLISTVLAMEKPVIAMVNGPAVGLGATIALLADIVVMADHATIADRHVGVGLVAGDGGAALWPLLVGPARAKEYLMTGRMLTGPEAVAVGLVSRSVPADDLEDTVRSLADDLAALPPYAVRGTKASVNRLVSQAMDTVVDTSLAYEHLSMRTEDHQEALRAREEGRRGAYRGR